MSDFKLSLGMWETEASIPALGTVLKIVIMQEGDSRPARRQLEILDSLAALSTDLRRDIANHARDYMQRVDSVVNLSEEGITIYPSNIENHYKFTTILIPEIYQCPANLFLIHARCDWEEEHGMQLLVEDGKVALCGEQSSLAFGSTWKRAISSPESRKQLLAELWGALNQPHN